MQEVCPGLNQIALGVSNTFLLQEDDALILIDAGPEDESDALLSTLREGDLSPSEIDHVLVTHAHQDHAGGLQAVKEAAGAPVWMHPRDADLVEQGRARRTWTVTPGPLHRILYWLYVRGVPDTVPPVEIDREIDGEGTLPFAENLRVLHCPGHCAGQIALLWERHGGVLLAADIALHLWGRPRLSVVYEDLEQGREDLRRLGTMNFEKAVFGHGDPIEEDAAGQFRRQFGSLGAGPSDSNADG